MGKGPKKDLKSMQNTLDGFVTRVAKSINQPEGAGPPPTTTVKDNKKHKNNQEESEAEKLSPQDKAPRTDNTDNSDNMDIEITEIIPRPRTHQTYVLTKNDLTTSIRYLGSLLT